LKTQQKPIAALYRRDHAPRGIGTTTGHSQRLRAFKFIPLGKVV